MKYKANNTYHNNAMDGFSGIGEEKHIKLKNGLAVDLDPIIAKPFIDSKMIEEVKRKGDK